MALPVFTRRRQSTGFSSGRVSSVRAVGVAGLISGIRLVVVKDEVAQSRGRLFPDAGPESLSVSISGYNSDSHRSCRGGRGQVAVAVGSSLDIVSLLPALRIFRESVFRIQAAQR